MALPLMKSRISATDTRRVKAAPKKAAAIYHTNDYRTWREIVINRASGRCEAITNAGTRCLKAAPRHRMFADHRTEIRDGGAPFDPANGQCLCGAHHTAKTAQARAARR